MTTLHKGYRESDKTFAPGERIIFTQNDKRLGVQNGLSGTIDRIDEQGNFFVNLKDNKKVVFNIADYAHIDYGYALTLYKSQGQTCRKAILVHSPNEKLNSEAFYVAATRATHEFTVLTPDKERLRKGVEKAQDKTSTREWGENGAKDAMEYARMEREKVPSAMEYVRMEKEKLSKETQVANAGMKK